MTFVARRVAERPSYSRFFEETGPKVAANNRYVVTTAGIGPPFGVLPRERV